MKKATIIKNQQGFTLVEIIAVLIILGILAAVAVPRYIDLEASSKQRALEAAVAELNGRESLAWADTKITLTKGWDNNTEANFIWTTDRMMKSSTDCGSNGAPCLGRDYDWGSTFSGVPSGDVTLKFKGSQIVLNRSNASSSQPAVWRKKP